MSGTEQAAGRRGGPYEFNLVSAGLVVFTTVIIMAGVKTKPRANARG